MTVTLHPDARPPHPDTKHTWQAGGRQGGGQPRPLALNWRDWQSGVRQPRPLALDRHDRRACPLYIPLPRRRLPHMQQGNLTLRDRAVMDAPPLHHIHLLSFPPPLGPLAAAPVAAEGAAHSVTNQLHHQGVDACTGGHMNMHTHMHTSGGRCLHRRAHAHTHAHTHARTHAHTCTHQGVDDCTGGHMHTHTHARTHTHTHMHTSGGR